MKKYLVLLVLFVPLLVSGLNTAEVTDISNSSMIYREMFYLYAGSQYKFRTYSSTEDTIIHVLNNSNVQVAWNDDCGSDCDAQQFAYNSTVTYTPTVSGYYYGIMRHYISGQIGKRANIKAFRDGTLIATRTNQPVGGSRITIDAWQASLQNWLQFHYFNRSKEEAGGALDQDTVLYLMSGNSITHFNEDSGAGKSARINRTSGSCSSSCRVLVGASSASPASEGNGRIIMEYLSVPNYPLNNWVSNDSDQDGISNQIETILGASSSNTDSDNDGLNDYIETFGYSDVALPWEGSSPIEKDVFVEVDYFGRQIAGSHVDFYEDNAADIENNLKYSFLSHGDIRIHIDVDDYIGIMNDTNTTKFALCENAPSPADPDAFYLADEKANYFTSSRTGIYYWVVAANRHSDVNETSSGLSCGSSGSGLGTDRIIISLGNRDFGGTLAEYSGTTVHEMGHAFMLGHNGNGNGYDKVLKFAPNGIIHRSVMNYRWQMGVPANVYVQNPLPPYNLISFDSPYRYSTDNSTYRTDLDWSYNNIVPETGANGCLNSQAEANSSLKKGCMDARPNAQPTCDCTFEEWGLLELDSAGVMGFGAGLVDGDSEQMEYSEKPVFGLNGEILAKNLEELTSSGEKFTKLTTDTEKKGYFEEREKLMKKFYTPEGKAMLREKYLETLKEKGLNEGQDYEIINGSIVFK